MSYQSSDDEEYMPSFDITLQYVEYQAYHKSFYSITPSNFMNKLTIENNEQMRIHRTKCEKAQSNAHLKSFLFGFFFNKLYLVS